MITMMDVVLLGKAQAGRDWVVVEGAVADDAHYHVVRSGEFYAQRGGDPGASAPAQPRLWAISWSLNRC